MRRNQKAPRPIRLTEVEKVNFWNNVDIGEVDACWMWRGRYGVRGYGSFTLSDIKIQGDRSFRAHRIAFVIVNGDIDLLVLHKCNNTSCCNPNHLYAGTHVDNMRDFNDSKIK